jgi:hypothetical protein
MSAGGFGGGGGRTHDPFPDHEYRPKRSVLIALRSEFSKGGCPGLGRPPFFILGGNYSHAFEQVAHIAV